MPREHGGLIVGGVQIASTLQCPHCGCHFDSIKGSGTRRAWCTRCSAVTCGSGLCDVCIPLEARLEHLEGKRTKHYDEIIAFQQAGGIL